MTERKTLFQETLFNIEKNKRNKDEGIYNSIPFGLPALDKHVPGIMRGIVYSIIASSGIGKTQLTKFLFVLQAYKFVKEHPELNLKLKIIWFALEESREEFMVNLICNRLKDKYKITISALQVRSMGENNLSEEILDKIRECEEYFNDMDGYLDIVDNCYNPTGLYYYCRDYASKNGTHYYRKLKDDHPTIEKSITKDQYEKLDNTSKELYCYFTYVANNPDEFVIVVTDHISLVDTEAGSDNKHTAMSKWSTDYCRKILAKRFNYCIVQVQQLEMVADKQQFSFSGDSIINKLLPSLSGLGDNKLLGRDYFVVLGLFAPERYQIPEYLGYNITILKDFFRTIHIVKNRLGTPNLILPVYYNGATNTFVQLPNAKSEEMKKIYTAVETSRLQINKTV